MTFIIPKLFRSYGPEPDEYDQGIVSVLLEVWNSHLFHSPNTPRVGDYIVTPEGRYRRAAYIWSDRVQTCDNGSFHLGVYSASMSGSLDPGYKRERIVPTDEKKEGTFWFFHHNSAFAHNGVGLSCACRVFKVI